MIEMPLANTTLTLTLSLREREPSFPPLQGEMAGVMANTAKAKHRSHHV